MRATAAASPAIVAARAAPTRRATDAAAAAKSFAAESDRARVLLGGRALAPRRRRARGASVASLSLDDDGDDDDGAPTRLDASRANRIKEMMASYAERHPSEADVTLEREKQKLTEEAPKAAAVSVFDDSPAGETLETRLKRLTTQSPVVLFMKGDRDEPRCGFSREGRRRGGRDRGGVLDVRHSLQPRGRQAGAERSTVTGRRTRSCTRTASSWAGATSSSRWRAAGR